MSCWEYIESHIRDHYTTLGDIVFGALNNPKSDPKEYKRLCNIVEKQIEDRRLDESIEDIFKEIIASPYARSNVVFPTKKNLSEPAAIQYCIDRGLVLKQCLAKNERFLINSMVIYLRCPLGKNSLVSRRP